MKSVRYLKDGREAVMQDDVASRMVKKGKVEIVRRRAEARKPEPQAELGPKFGPAGGDD